MTHLFATPIFATQSARGPLAEQSWRCPDWRQRAVATVIFLLLTAYLFRTLLADSLSRWSTEPQYSHGFVIPLMAVGLGWVRRSQILPGMARCGPVGCALLGIGIVGHLIADYLYVEALDGIAFLLCMAGGVQLIWGNRFIRGVFPAVAFLGFMMPLPFQFERMLSDPLQILGATESAYFIQTLGIPAIAQGNTILLGDTRLGVADACSGLRMLMVFLAISVAAAIVSRRTLWNRGMILLSAIPIALLCNVARIVATAVAHQTVGRQTADLIFHDLSGWLMMPLAMLLLYLELKLFDWLFVEIDDRIPGFASRKIFAPRRVMPQMGLARADGIRR